jgi:cell division septal protein FtsQ
VSKPRFQISIKQLILLMTVVAAIIGGGVWIYSNNRPPLKPEGIVFRARGDLPPCNVY